MQPGLQLLNQVYIDQFQPFLCAVVLVKLCTFPAGGPAIAGDSSVSAVAQRAAVETSPREQTVAQDTAAVVRSISRVAFL